MLRTTIERIQGDGLRSPHEGADVVVQGVVTGSSRRGFFIQSSEPSSRAGSSGIFVFERGRRPQDGALVEVTGRVVDFCRDEGERPTTQIEERETRVLEERGPRIEPVWLGAEDVLVPGHELARRLNALEGMLVGLRAGATFAAPSNPFGDYVVLPEGADLARTEQGGVLIDPAFPERWLPSLRVLSYGDAPLVHVGAKLLGDVVGPLNFRANAYQIAARGAVRAGDIAVASRAATLTASDKATTVLTLNGFNLDPHREDPARVQDPGRDVDDDIGDGRFHDLARVIATEARAPDIVALQEIQDSDGAEITEVVSAHRTLNRICATIEEVGGPAYHWAEIPPEAGADGGQPGGNIRNAFLFRPDRVELLRDSLHRLGETAEPYEGSRKPLAARFRVRGGYELEVINVHLASKRQQHGVFAPERPGFDPRLPQRVAQAELIAARLAELRREGVEYYVTGDFNDFEFSDTLGALCGSASVNLTDHVPHGLRFDYNHRGLSQALMHGVCDKRQFEAGRAAYEILHTNALLGSQPGTMGTKPSDHAYVLARLEPA